MAPNQRLMKASDEPDEPVQQPSNGETNSLTAPLLLLSSAETSPTNTKSIATATVTTSISTRTTVDSSIEDDADADYVLLLSRNDDVVEQDAYSYTLDPQRFMVLTVFALNNLLASACWITFAPIEDAVQVRYGGITANQVNWLSMIMMAMYGPGTLVCSWTIPKYGLKGNVMVSSLLLSLGGLLRWWSMSWVSTTNNNTTMAYTPVLSGQGIVSLGQCVFQNAPARVATAWFQKTSQAIGVCVFSGTLGMLFGQALSPLLVEETTGRHLDQLLGGQALVIFACTVATCYWFQSQPVLPPSPAEAARRRQSTTTSASTADTSSSLKRDVWKLATDLQYQLLLIAFGIAYGVNSAVLTILQPWIAAAGYQGDAFAGLCGSLAIVGGVVATLIAAPLLDHTRNYNQAVRWSFLVAFWVAILTVATLAMPMVPIAILGAVFFIMGMSQLPLLTIVLDAAAAHSYPIPEELSSAGLQLVGQYLGVILVDILGGLLPKDENDASNDNNNNNNNNNMGFTAPVNVAFMALMGTSALLALFYQGDDPRSAANNNNNGSNNNNNNSAVATSGNDNHRLAEEGTDDDDEVVEALVDEEGRQQ